MMSNKGRQCSSICRKLHTYGSARCILVRSNTEPFVSRKVVREKLVTTTRANTDIANVPSGSAIGVTSRSKGIDRAPSHDDM